MKKYLILIFYQYFFTCTVKNKIYIHTYVFNICTLMKKLCHSNALLFYAIDEYFFYLIFIWIYIYIEIILKMFTEFDN